MGFARFKIELFIKADAVSSQVLQLQNKDYSFDYKIQDTIQMQSSNSHVHTWFGIQQSFYFCRLSVHTCGVHVRRACAYYARIN